MSATSTPQHTPRPRTPVSVAASPTSSPRPTGCAPSVAGAARARRVLAGTLAVLAAWAMPAATIAAGGAGDTVVVTQQAGRLTVRASDVELSAVMQAIGRRAGISIRMSPDIDERVSLDLDALPVDEALRRILEGWRWVMIHDPQHAQAAPSEVWIYGRGATGRPPVLLAGSGPAPGAASGEDDSHSRAVRDELAKLWTAPLSARLRAVQRLSRLDGVEATTALGRILSDDQDADVRQHALDALSERDDEAVPSALERGLGDADPDFRIQVLEALVDVAGEAAIPGVGQVLFGDSDADVRLMAVEHLADLPGDASRSLLEAATQDPDELVRAAAIAALSGR